MENNISKTKNNDNLGASFLRAVKTGPRGDISSNDFFESEKKSDLFDLFPKETEAKPSNCEQQGLPDGQAPLFMNSFIIELAGSIKNTLSSIYHASVLTMEKFDDADIRKRSHNQIRSDIRRIDSVLNSLLNYININTPIERTNSLCIILEEILEANDRQLREKDLKIVKKCEENLPETYVHNEQVRFILHSVLQYAIFLTPRNETIGFLLKSLDFQDQTDTKKGSPEKKKGYVEVVVGFDGDGKLVGPLENLLKMPEEQRQPTDLILILVNEILIKNRGSMTIESNGKRPKTLITLRVPIERRNVVNYAPITL
jgi:hypothetical protein